MDGIVRVENPSENIVVIAFDDNKADKEKIIQALIDGRMNVYPIAAAE